MMLGMTVTRGYITTSAININNIEKHMAPILNSENHIQEFFVSGICTTLHNAFSMVINMQLQEYNSRKEGG